MILDLLRIMFERVGIIIAVAFILTRFRFFKNMIIKDKLNLKQEIAAIIFFGLFGIAGTYLGVVIDTGSFNLTGVSKSLDKEEAIANARVIGIVIAGMLGGYRIGIGAGLIAGIHRMTLGGFTAFSCGFSTIIAGVLASAFYRRGSKINPL